MNSTLFYTVYMYQQSFLFGSTGYGAALAWIMLALIAFITWILFATKNCGYTMAVYRIGKVRRNARKWVLL